MRIGGNDLPLMTREEITRRLKDWVSLPPIPCIALFTGTDKTQINRAKAGERISDKTQVRMTWFFYRWDRGEITFHWRKGKYEIEFHPPKPAPEAQMRRCVKMTPDGPIMEWVKVDEK
jgi:hypothetical protein